MGRGEDRRLEGGTHIPTNIDDFGNAARLARRVMARGYEDGVLVLSERFEEGIGIVDMETLDVDGDGD